MRQNNNNLIISFHFDNKYSIWWPILMSENAEKTEFFMLKYKIQMKKEKTDCTMSPLSSSHS